MTLWEAGYKIKERADVLLIKQGLAPSREKAKALIMAGQVFDGTNRIDKAGEMLGVDRSLQVKGQVIPYVSRGGLKLEKALEIFTIDPQGKVMLDIGASTGGFTDCALQKGAAKVFAIDVGYGQLDWRLRQDPKVIVKEKTNARYLTLEDLGEKVDMVTIDVSFISRDKIFPVLPGLLNIGGTGVALIKPQFEAGKDHVGNKGVVRDPKIHWRVLRKIVSALAQAGMEALGLTHSPIRGPEGNIEYLMLFGLPQTPAHGFGRFPEDRLAEAVQEAFAEFEINISENWKKENPEHA
jgi:23S rRNA (cytidine1920-2'-O)/16S rRNA (cytidine1409-2'-O)-methyltransferase